MQLKKEHRLILLIFVILGVPIIYAASKKPVQPLLTIDPDASFSLVVLPDTQYYSEKYPKIFCDQTEWILEQKDKINIKFMSHVGDIVENGAKYEKEWKVADKCLGKLDGKIAYSIVPGNHDTEIESNRDSGFATYNRYFPVSRFAAYSWYKGNYKENQNSYQIFEANGRTFMFLNLEVEPTNDVLDWARDVIRENEKKHRDLFIILTTHKYLRDDKPSLDNQRQFGVDGNTGQDIWNKLVYPNCSIKMVLSGHFNRAQGENRLLKENACGYMVSQVIQDYQERENGGNGLLRIYVFTPASGRIKVYTYSPYTETFEVDETSQFELRM